MLLTFPLITVSALSLIVLLVTGRYELEFVSLGHQQQHADLSAHHRAVGRAVRLAGVLVLADVGVRYRGHPASWSRDREFLPWVIVVSLVTLAFFLILIIFFENPFERIWQSAPAASLTWQCSSRPVPLWRPSAMGRV